MAEFVQHESCPGCGSSDGLARYDDNSAHCFACKEHNEKGDGQEIVLRDDTGRTDWKPIEGHYQALTGVGLDEETCRRWRYSVGHLNDGTPCHLMESRDDDGRLIAQKFRTKESKGQWIGQAKDPPLYGKWLWPAGGKYLTITEGEKDALSLSKAFDHKYPVVSLPNGTGSVRKVIKRDYDYINSFSTIVLMFDMDEPGRAAVEEALELLPAGKVKIAKLPLKDANDVLREMGKAELVKAFWQAETYRPDGIKDGSEITLDDILTASTPGYELVGTPELQAKLLGLRKAEITLLTAGSGIGKSTWARQLAYLMHEEHGLKIGNVFLEEPNVKTAQAYIALDQRVPLGRFRYDTSIIPREKVADSHQRLMCSGRMKFYDHFGSLASDNLLSKLRYLAQVEKCDFIVLDHISIVTSGLESSSEGERKDIDILMTRLAQLVQETGVGIIAIVHLKRTKDKSPNEGDTISLSDLRGSAALEQLSFNVLAMERDQQAEDGAKDHSLIRVLKCRETGDTGTADTLVYNRKTGWLDLSSPFEAVSPFDPHSSDSDEALPF